VVAAALLWRRRVPALHAASFIWLVVFVVNPNFSYQYLIWGLPFFIAAGYLEAVAVFQVAIVPAMLWLYWRPGLDPGGWAYFVSIQLVWAGLIAALVVGIRKLMRGELPSERLTPAGP
jgi:hypothetical protein